MAGRNRPAYQGVPMRSVGPATLRDKPPATPALSWRGWLIWGVGAAFYFYGFFQRVAPSAMIADLMRDFGAGAAILGNLSAFYFYSYAAVQVPVGVLLDRFGARRMLAAAALLCAAGSLLYTVADTLPVAYAGRLLIGFGAGVSYIGALFLAARWLAADRFALVTGLTIGAGTLGAVLGQAPLAAAVSAFGWRPPMLWAVAAALALAALFWFATGDGEAPKSGAGVRPKLLDGLKLVLMNRQTWLFGPVGFAVAGPVLAFGGLWGVAYIMQVYGVERPVAASITSLMLIGFGIGGPVQGWLSDRLRRRKPLIVGALVLNGLIWVLLLALPGLPLPLFAALLAAAGFFSGAMALVFATARELTPPLAVGAVSGVTNMVLMTSGALLQPWIGLVLDWQWDGAMAAGTRVYAPAMYETAFLTFPILFVGSFLLALGLRETRARPVTT